MSEKGKSFLISLICGAIISALVCLLTKQPEAGIIQCLCDGFFVAGVLVTGSGGLLFARNGGIFDIFGFSVKSLFGFRLLWSSKRDDDKKKSESYAEYRERKRETRKSPIGTVLAGLVYLALAGVMLVIYMLQ